MNLPFSREQFYEVFACYNEAVWPAPLWLMGMAALSITAILWRWRHTDRLVGMVLGILWLWSGVMYHLVFFRSVNPAALIFGLLFVVQSTVFFWSALR
ncbi:MAG TPA: DUF6064 family protein, partial [Opitutus sp.]|nr:DUF6064 family protein [Opitutus sp.]